ncbi:RNA-binding S4 domain-containing protein [Vibrio ulleungensis]|uniref:RNA-binding S4 domain-containing protein n=1 Tax=Vibrio ulleungensis TaxID=2807619 RepID=A0ABS2HIY7_9VIBR|nr:RNA-binding S4 domain-containing protein [Vibrio ulleungensis]MBM7036979.1 RNA-binding S4 domain-containing protein [Vibrio ulleungensis]
MSDFDDQEIEVEAEEVLITQEPVELYKILKLANLVDGGGQAKHLIGEGYVAVNGELEFRKRRKTYDGDVVQVGDQFFVVMLADEEVIAAASYDASLQAVQESEITDDVFESEPIEDVVPTPAANEAVEQQTKDAEDAVKPGKKGRKSIDFF